MDPLYTALQPTPALPALSSPAPIGQGQLKSHLPVRFLGSYRIDKRLPPAAKRRGRTELASLELVTRPNDDRPTIDPGVGLNNPAQR